MNNRGTKDGDIFEIQFVKKFNSNKSQFLDYLLKLNISELKNFYMIRVTTHQISKLNNKTVMTRADAYLIESHDVKLQKVLEKENYYLDETILYDLGISFKKVINSGISIKMNDSYKYQILKLTPESFKTLFGEYELGAGASIYCMNEDEISKNVKVAEGWKTSLKNIADKFETMVPNVKIILDSKINDVQKMSVYKSIKIISNETIATIINNSSELREKIFNGIGLYEEPYTAHYFYKNGNIEVLTYIPFNITTGSGRSRGDFTIVLKPQ